MPPTASPEKGLYTAIVAGFIISVFGGSRFQIGGPAGAFIVLLASIIDRHGFDGLLLVTLMAGLILLGVGLLRLGTYIKYVPHPVTVGFTAGIAVIIFASQIKELLGLQLPGAEPAELVPKLRGPLAIPSQFEQRRHGHRSPECRRHSRLEKIPAPLARIFDCRGTRKPSRLCLAAQC